MRTRILLSFLTVSLFVATTAFAQISEPAPTSGAAPDPSTSSQATASPEMASDLTAYGQMLGQLQQLAQQTASDLGRLRIDKWKTDSGNKQQTQSNTQSLQRNLTAALPELIQKAQKAPQDLGPSFRLYRNLNVVYDVLSSTAESAGAFGPKEQYEPLANDIGALDQLRHSMADRLDWLAGVKDSQLIQIRQQLAASQQHLQQQQAKTKVDETKTDTSAKKSTTKKKKKAAATPPPSE